MQERKRYTSEQKVMILKELLENNIPISQVAEKYGVHVNDIYNWKKKLFENASTIFESKTNSSNSVSEQKINKLEEKLKKREEVITYLVNENIELKKNLDGEV